ncbi:hypothetical protein C7414_10241 [Cupriavidus alkaliphilus]|uniref:hypothetical protein n=1 Tax=Cupriavidus alkaliphilus TaxID=942866 RepID=UPI000DE6C2EC|nr:hypothetical protein [Cupriavidus alkaliphilus]PVY80728.1 hypothetical protein C7414_10241 [Cupriavidus alkaliphilus]
MQLLRKRRLDRACALMLGLCAAGTARAAPDDVFMQAEPATGEFTSVRVEASYDMVNRTVDVFNLRGRQGPVSDNAGDYRGGKLMLGYKFSPHWSGSATYWRRGIEYGQDRNHIDTWMLAMHYDPLAEAGARDRIMLRFSLWGDHAGSLDRSSPVMVRNITFNSLTVNNANDVQAQADVIFSGELSERNQLTGFVGLGISRVTVGSLNTRLQRGNCNFNVAIGSDNLANGQLAAPCNVGNVTLQSASFSVNASQFGLDFNDDFNYTAGYLNLGGSWRWKYERFAARLGYQFQYLLRSNVDSRAETYGNAPIRSNHTLGLELSYGVAKNVEVFLRGQASLYNFVGTIPFLYNATTAGKLDRYYGYGSIGIRFSGF